MTKITVDRVLIEQAVSALETPDGLDEYNRSISDVAIEALRAALAEPAVAPVAWRVHPATYGVGHDGVYALTTRTEQVDAWRRKGWDVEPLYTSPPPPAEHGCKFPLCQTEEYQQMLGAQVARELIGVPLLSDVEVGMLTVYGGLHHVDVSLLAEFVRHVETTVRRKAGL